MFLLRSSCAALLLVAGGCVDTRADPAVVEPESVPLDDQGVSIDLEGVRAVVPEHAYGLHASVYDNSLHDAGVPELVQGAGVRLLRYPGGGYSDNYHWSSHELSLFHASGNATRGYLAENSDFPSFMRVAEAAGATVMVTANYGTNLAGTGPGEPKEAAAWVAYANGDPESELEIGEDASGVDWHTVGYWASLRAATPDPEQPDALDFLRISRREPFGIRYWEIGNEVFGNGYYGQNYEEDLHVAYEGGEEGLAERAGHAALSGSTYGAGVLEFAEAMKAVDPDIAVGAVLNSVYDTWGPGWNRSVLSVCGSAIDFGIVHYYPGHDPASLLAAPRRQIQSIVDELFAQFASYGGENFERIGIAVTELGPGVGLDFREFPEDRHAIGLFALDAYLSFLRAGAFNVDWLELHNGTFLSEYSNARGHAYYGIELAHRLAEPGDALLATTSSAGALVVHAARKADGRVGLLVTNTRARGNPDTRVTIDVTGGVLGTTGERYDFAPAESGPSPLVGPEPITDFTTPFSLSIPPYQATLFLLDPA
jgi:hypothetical protein